MKSFLFLIVFIFGFVRELYAQENFHSFKINSISAEFKLVPANYANLSFDEIRNFSKDPNSFTPVDLSTYHEGNYKFSDMVKGQYLFKSPEGPVNPESIMTKTRFGINISLSMLNHKTNEYRRYQEITVGLYYQPWLYHQSHNVRTDTLITDTIHFNYVYYDEYSPVLGIEGTYCITSDQDKWLSASAGIGVGMGVAIHPQVYETFGVMSGKVISDTTTTFPRYDFMVLSNTQNVFTGKSSVLLEIRVPIRINVRLAGALGFFLVMESLASKQIYFQDVRSFSFSTSTVAAIGLRLRF